MGANEAFKFPGVLILVRKGDPTGGSVGSIVNHIGFYVANIQQSLDKWKAAGLKTESGQRAGQAYVTSPDGLVRIENGGAMKSSRIVLTARGKARLGRNGT